MTETKTEKKVRKAKEQKLRDKVDKLLLEASPDLMAKAINASLGIARNIICPFCEGKFDVELGDKANKDLLKALIEHVKGRPKQTTEIDLNAKLELDNTQLLRLFGRLEEFKKEQAQVTIESVEAEFKAIPEPELPVETPTPSPAMPILAAPEEPQPKPPPEMLVDKLKSEEESCQRTSRL